MRPPPRSTCSISRGYTAVEVLMAMTVMAIGGAAVITMQKTSITANLDARKSDIAYSIAQAWVDRLQRESMAWTATGPLGNTSNLANVGVLGNILNAEGQWFLPNQDLSGPPGTASPGFDILGRDLPSGQLGNADFCVNVRLTWLNPPPLGDLILADVRVIWPIGIVNSAPGFCNGNVAALPDPNTAAGQRDPNADPTAPLFHTLYTTTALREN